MVMKKTGSDTDRLQTLDLYHLREQELWFILRSSVIETYTHLHTAYLYMNLNNKQLLSAWSGTAKKKALYRVCGSWE